MSLPQPVSWSDSFNVLNPPQKHAKASHPLAYETRKPLHERKRDYCQRLGRTHSPVSWLFCRKSRWRHLSLPNSGGMKPVFLEREATEWLDNKHRGRVGRRLGNSRVEMTYSLSPSDGLDCEDERGTAVGQCRLESKRCGSFVQCCVGAATPCSEGRIEKHVASSRAEQVKKYRPLRCLELIAKTEAHPVRSRHCPRVSKTENQGADREAAPSRRRASDSPNMSRRMIPVNTSHAFPFRVFRCQASARTSQGEPTFGALAS